MFSIVLHLKKKKMQSCQNCLLYQGIVKRDGKKAVLGVISVPFHMGRAEGQMSAGVVSAQLHWASASLEKSTHACLSSLKGSEGPMAGGVEGARCLAPPSHLDPTF